MRHHQQLNRIGKRKFAYDHTNARPQGPKQSHLGPRDDSRKVGLSKIEISRLSPDEIDTYIALLEAKARAAGPKPTSLADRVTHDRVETDQDDDKPEKELSPEKLEKIEKRRQLRLAKKEEKRARKAAEAGVSGVAESASVQGSAGSLAQSTKEASENASTAAPAESAVRSTKDASDIASAVAPLKSPVRATKQISEKASSPAPTKSPVRSTMGNPAPASTAATTKSPTWVLERTSDTASSAPAKSPRRASKGDADAATAKKSPGRVRSDPKPAGRRNSATTRSPDRPSTANMIASKRSSFPEDALD